MPRAGHVTGGTNGAPDSGEGRSKCDFFHLSFDSVEVPAGFQFRPASLEARRSSVAVPDHVSENDDVNRPQKKTKHGSRILPINLFCSRARTSVCAARV